MNLNEGQALALQQIQDWLAGSQPYFFLSGAAGTGKTTLASYILDWAERALCLQCHVTASTNKAAAVLQEIMPDRETTTIYSLLGLRVMNDIRTGKQYLKKASTKKNPEYGSLVMVDEASMLDVTTMDYINKATQQYDLRVLFLGDAYQLPPVNAGTMPVTSDSIPSFHLTEIMRANRRLDLEEAYRQGRLMVGSPGIYIPNASENISVFRREEGTEYLGNLLQANPHAKILAFTNKVVENLNLFSREKLGLSLLPQAGDELVLEDVVIENGMPKGYIGEIIEVESVEDIEVVHGTFRLPAQEIVTTAGVRYVRLHDPAMRQQILKTEANAANWPTYFRLKETLADLRFTHASTVHKSQGSTYEDVVVVTPNIMSCPSNNTRQRLLYVAYTRASRHLHIMVE